MLQRKQVPFEVSPDSPALVVFEIWDQAIAPAILLRLINQDQSNSDRECSICHGTSAEDTVYLKCEQYRTDIHLQCMESWLKAWSTSINFDCLICREHQWFDVIYSAPVATRRRRTAPKSPEETITVSMEVASGESPAQAPRRSGRARRPPQRYVPEA
ncbi:uncharacterized protein NFIA_023870 [Aspergillus fischeri NRRL 181]|uniref:RING-type domain-containing protein n=1 Tax=Neosartorya fischeri (strain ATCC 1020 / DSM 3700 / CBS 544.65 / FGSC A1164 / JCM 1740 / NRRL 181 / WB 181) TaxID=331117 RepID=A1D5G4_NEOFI|nr:uncharacterized protein NFIA_023870 [Aspergillus fischeri NRRL 181]EAW22018.1 hypothetical protein NFIA_023870 [Aspergillus fischeri NRRL 181]KAG2001096.1 hypothetical protein GB937_010518 [Aspergillus fischeri]